MADSDQAPRLLFPQLRPFYDAVAPYVYPMIRFVTGALLVPHGWSKVMAGAQKVAEGSVGKIAGASLAIPAAYFVTYLELIGGVMIAVGLLTRFVASALAIQFAIITFVVHWSRGFSASSGGWEFVFLWGILFFAIALKGGGNLSVDRKLGWVL